MMRLLLLPLAAAYICAPTTTRAPTALQAKTRKKANRLREMKDLKDGGQGAVDEWARTIEQRLDAAASDGEREALEEALLDLCGATTRDLDALDGAVADLAALPKPAAADAARIAGGDWKLVWARSDEGVGAIGTGLHRVPLANLEDIFLSIDARRVTTTEVIRVLGPFPNVKNLLFGACKVKPSRLEFSYDRIIDGTGKELTNSQARDAAFGVAALSRRVLVLAATGVGATEWLVFEREDDLADALQKLRVAPNEEEAESAAPVVP
eukprot:CAMPEP_0119269638 /NCGR_PEP_ID=MMETSP1329-20130426/6968_1 /TAXON_ID=114041 /ORGANISM="Genus nov. species nov., Strain RCC1024" /LENGTH=266 /DNA_ID=CAMNT_0007269639 /DNA_START=205 /DNA_END=1001 /DNA_ORIENTATION=+